MSSRKAQYDIKYARENLKRIPLDVQKEFYESIKEEANRRGESVNGFIKNAIREYMKL